MQLEWKCLNSVKDEMERMLDGKLFQSEGALNIKDFLAMDLETAGAE